MLFNSIEFLIFFPIVTLLFYLLRQEYRWSMLLLASCIFYMYFIPSYIFILFLTIIIDYFAGIYIEKSDPNKKKLYLVLSIVSTCLVLIIFKYLNFLNHNLFLISRFTGFSYPDKTLQIILPIGLSFHTFQSLSYVIEVYRGRQKAEKHFGIYSLYVMFYPQLVTGPIERPQNLLTQLRETKHFKIQNIVDGIRLIVFGLFTKMVIADNLGTYVDQIYSNPTLYNSSSIVIGLIFYSFQIYCDFYGYSTIAVGCAKSMGFNLMDNFKHPYLSQSISEFWQRWHISLSTWFRDYVYFSLGGNKVGVKRWILNILVVFVLSGLWHGANWTFILWGAVHGIIYIIESHVSKIPLSIPSGKVFQAIVKYLRILKNFSIVTLIWILFRAANISQVNSIFKSIKQNFKLSDDFHVDQRVWLFLICFVIFDSFLFNSRFDKWCQDKPVIIRWITYSILLYSIIVFSSVTNYPFIYFQF